jgi:hypothetical protein
VAAHIAGLLFPRGSLLSRTPGRLLALEAVGFAVGLAALRRVSGWRGKHARLHRAAAGGCCFDFADSVFLTLLFIASRRVCSRAGITLGLAWARDGAPYAASLVHGRPSPRSSSTCRCWSACTCSRRSRRSRVCRRRGWPGAAGARAPRAGRFAGRALAAAAARSAPGAQRALAARLWPDAEVAGS